VVFGLAASGLLLVVYFLVLALVSGWEQGLVQFGEFWPWVVALAAGFGTQIGLYVRLRSLVRHGGGSGQVVAVTGGTSTAAMISCCTHYVANVVPILGASGLVALVAQYQTQLLWVGLAFNAAGVAYVGRQLWRASRHMALMQAEDVR
jgi:Cu+-exporting ATPase